jgi:phage-related minor tail protein
VERGGAYLVGEAGPELFIPGRSGTVVPNDALGGVTIANGDINITGSGVTMPQVVQALELQHRRTIAAVRELQRR